MNTKRKRWGRFPGLGLALPFLLLFFACPGFAEPAITHVFTQEGSPAVMWYIRGLPEDAAAQAVTVGGYEGAVAEQDRLSALSGLTYKTVILLDNSKSISEPNREKAKALIRSLLERHAAQEEFSIYTFSTELKQIGQGTDYAALAEAVSAITNEDQDAWLVECTAGILEEFSQDGAEYYDRLVLISDGVDDNPSGRSFGDLQSMLEQERYCRPIYTVGSIWEKQKSGLKELETLARKSNGKSFVLDETEDVAQIAEEIDEDYGAQYFMLDIPLEEKDGTPKEVQLTIGTYAGTQTLSRIVPIPQRTPEEEELLQSLLNPQETESETPEQKTEDEIEETDPPKVIQLVVEEDGPQTPEEPEKTSEESDPFRERLWIVLLIAAGAGLSLLLLILLLRRRKKKVWDDEAFYEQFHRESSGAPSYGGEETEWSEAALRQDDFDRTVGPRDKTVALWANDALRSEGKRISLEEIEGDGSYDFGLFDEAVIGRSGRCNVTLPGDPSVSKVHCKIILGVDEVTLEDLGSTNGSFINGQRVTAPTPLHDGDELRLGKKRLRANIHPWHQ